MMRSALLLAVIPVISGAQNVHSHVEARLLAAHNHERLALGLKPLQWNAQLTQGAKNWADTLARTGQFQHAPRGRGTRAIGENLWAGTTGYFQPEVMVTHWIDEKRHFKQGRFPYVSKTGHMADVGHYTQIVWRDTTQVGCAISSTAREDILVCRYAAAGNIIGQKPF